MDCEDDQLLTVPEVAHYLRMGQESTRRWLRNGKLHGINLGRKSGWRVRRGDLAAFIAHRRTPLAEPRDSRTSPPVDDAADGREVPVVLDVDPSLISAPMGTREPAPEA